jgi:cytochrome c-type biogenesis protein CcmE
VRRALAGEPNNRPQRRRTRDPTDEHPRTNNKNQQAMTRKQRRLTLIAAGVGVLGLAVALVLSALKDSIVFFNSPSDLVEKHVAPGTRVRLGGLVVPGSIVRGADLNVGFEVSDGNRAVQVTYQGVLPDLFREGQGVVTEGALETSGTFKADSVLAKHDEKYMPKEVADALKKQGHWKDEYENKKPAAGTRTTP